MLLIPYFPSANVFAFITFFQQVQANPQSPGRMVNLEDSPDPSTSQADVNEPVGNPGV